jgi:integrase
VGGLGDDGVGVFGPGEGRAAVVPGVDAKVVDSVATGEHRHDDRQTVGAYLAEWIDAKEANGLRPATVAVYRVDVERDIVPALGTVRLGELRPGHVLRLLRDLREAGRGPTTIRRVHAPLRSALSSARRARLVPYNAAIDVDLPPLSPAEVQPWTKDELADFLDHAAGHRLGALFELLAFTGMRCGEACGLRWSDIELARTAVDQPALFTPSTGRPSMDC